MDCTLVLFYALVRMSCLVCANQASEEGPLPSHYLPSVVSTISSPFLVVASTKISGLINTTTSKNIAKGSIQTQSTTNGINVASGKSSPTLSDTATMVSNVGVSTSQGAIHLIPTTSSFYMQTSGSLISSVMTPLPTTASPPGTPDPPIIQNITVLSATSVLVKWNTTSDQSVATNYSVEFSVNISTWKQPACNHSLVQGACVVNQKQAVIVLLKPFTNYTFRVVAKSQFGRSNYSAERKWVMTDEAAPSAAPVITTAHNVGSQEIFIAWQPPPAGTENGIFKNYEIYIKKETHQEPTTIPTTGGSPVTEPLEPTPEPEFEKLQSGSLVNVGLVLNYTVRNLDKWTNYELKVRAVTIAPGPFSDKFIVRTDEDVPSQPRHVVARALNSSAIYLNWSEPADKNGVLLYYQVKWDSSGKTFIRKIGLKKSVILSPLNPFTLYVINVSALTSKGEGKRVTVEEQTDEGVPSAPQNLSTKTLNATAIRVSWKEPKKLNGKIKYRLSCERTGEPSAVAKLLYDGNNTQFIVSDLKPYTRYTFRVTAYNLKYNLSSSEVFTEETTDQAAPSGPPLDLQAVTKSSSSIILSWLPPTEEEQNGKITSYNIQITSISLGESRNVSTMGNATRFAFSVLQPYTVYWFKVQAVTEAGVGPFSNLSSTTTLEAEPSPPRNVTAKSVNSTAIRVSWVKALNPNGKINYKLRVRLSGEKEEENRPVYEGNDTTYLVTGLQEYVKYAFTVVSFNIKNKWESKPVVVVESTRPSEPSGPPQNVQAWTLSSTSIQVTWGPPLLEEQNGVILRYDVEYKTQSGQPNKLATADNQTIIQVKNLTSFTRYWFAVRAVNVIGVGPESEEVSNTTSQDRPSPPVKVSAKTVNSTAIKVTWEKPLHPNGEIFYRLYYWQTREGAGTKLVAYEGALMEYVVGGLHEYVPYTFMVQAHNVRYSWSSAGTNATETTHPAAPSGPPLNVAVFAESSTSLLVKWNPPTELERNGVITYYIIRYTSLGEESSINTTDNTTQKLIPHLRKFTEYYVTVQAVNDIGAGPPSVNDTKNTTLEDLPGEPVIDNVTSNTYTLALTWKPPIEKNGILIAFRLCWRYVEERNYSCENLSAAESRYEIKNLKAYSLYNISLEAQTSVGFGPAATNTYRTSEGVPSKPLSLRAWNTSENTIYVTWKRPARVNGILKSYKVFNRAASDSSQYSTENIALGTNFTLVKLQPYTSYNVTVQAFTAAGGGEKTDVQVMTDEAAPSEVRELSFPKIQFNSVEVSWEAPERPNGNIGYYLSYWELSGDFSRATTLVLPGEPPSKLVPYLKPFTNYTFSVQPYNLRKNLTGLSTKRNVRTKATRPEGPPRKVKIESKTSTSFTLSWNPPLQPNGHIVGYKIRYFMCNSSHLKTIEDTTLDSTHTIQDLQPFRCYGIQVACQSSGGLGDYSVAIESRTDPAAPPPLGTLPPPDEEEIDGTSFTVKLTKASNKLGVVQYYRVIVREFATNNRDRPVPADNEPKDYREEELYTYEEAREMKPKLVPYVAVEFPADKFDSFKNFKVGDGKRYSRIPDDIVSKKKRKRRRRRREIDDSIDEFYNGPLEENTFYAVFQRAYVNKDVFTSSEWMDPVATAAARSPSEAPPSSSNTGLIVGIVFVLLIVPVVLAAAYFIWKKRFKSGGSLDDRDDFTNGHPMRMRKSRKRRSLQKRLMGSTESLNRLDELAASRARRHPVPIDDFERHVERMHMDGDHGFSEEYLLVQPEEEFSFQHFLNPTNKFKNRYANIVAYDHTRVLLNPIDGVAGSDYINASFIDGYNRQRAYIAAQGPLMETFDDFWRMMWEQMCSVIIMLTKLEERGRRKCDQYWPERGTRKYGQVQVTLKETLNMSHYTVRKMVMSHKLFPEDEREVKQFHFTAWPDHGVPSHPTPLLSLVRHAYVSNRESVGPMVVHCSAGVGRTGTFITLDVMLQRISQEDSIDVFGFVRQMRFQRNFMVQTEAQYVFIHDALLEAITCGVTEVEAKDLGTRIRELRQVDQETGYTYLENEFCRLAKEENHPIAFKSASLNCNASKNRYANILPFESTRVHLKMRPGEMGSDYINANYIDGYCQPRAYVATQAPVPDTFEDFWRLIWEQESAAIVMLTREEEAGKVKCHHYWPSEGSRLYGVILVELIEENSFADYITRKFKLTHTEEKNSHTVCQFQYTDWPDTGLPDSGVGIVDLIGQVQKWQQQSGNTAIVIHCSGGVGRTGVFCGISIMIERLKAEGVIDVFQTVQAMRLQRPAMVQTTEQYEFCYTTLQEYLDSFDLYANFQ